MDDMLDQLGQCKYFSTLDLAAGFWQIRVHPDSAEKTAFSTSGIVRIPSHADQRPQQSILLKVLISYLPSYIDDNIIIFSATLEQHLTHLKAVLERLVSS